MQRRVVVPALTSLLLASSLAAAQPAKPKAPVAPPAPPAQSTPPAPIQINDPMLAPVPPATKILNHWREALGFITSRSLDVATGYQEILRAEGLRRQALGGALGTINATGTVTGQVITGTSQGTPAQTVNGTFTLNGSQVPFTATTPAQAGVALPTTNPSVNGSLTASIQIFAPRIWYAIGTADMSIASAKLSYDDKRRTVLTTVANSIVAVITSERVADINRNGLKSALERLDLTQRKFRLGDATRLDVLRAEQDAATARATLVSGDEGLRQAREALGLSLGYHDAFGVPPGISLNEIESTVGGVCSAGKLDDRADIKQARNDVEVAKRGITDAWLAFSPTASLSTTVSVSNNSQAQADGKVGAWSIQGVLTIPLWEGGARYGSLKIAKVNAEEAKIKLEASMRTATIQVAQALRGVAVAEQARAVSQTTRDLARESARLAQRAYEVGTGTSFDLVDTAKAERSAELDLAVKDFNVISARLSAMLAAANCTY
jgi:outer membrane protein TolC